MSAPSLHAPAAPREPNPEFAMVASLDRLGPVARALEARGMSAQVVSNSAEARDAAREWIPAGSRVFTATSRTLDLTGIAADVNSSGRYDALRPKMVQLDRRTQSRAIRELVAAPEYVVGSVHSITEGGEVVIASATGSQLAQYAFAADHVLWVVGAQKITADLETAFRRVREYSLPLEDARAREAYGVGSVIAKWLVVDREPRPGRTRVILVAENLGF